MNADPASDLENNSLLARIAEAKTKAYRSAHVVLSAFSTADVDDTYRGWLLDPEIQRYLEARFQDLSLDGLAEYVRTRESEQTSLFMKIEPKSGGSKIGTVSLRVDKNHMTGSYGYLVGDKSRWGTTDALEAQVVLMDIAFCDLNLRKVTGGVIAGNLASHFNLRRLGFEREGTAREQVLDPEGQPQDVVRYGLLEREWQAKRGEFERFRGQES